MCGSSRAVLREPPPSCSTGRAPPWEEAGDLWGAACFPPLLHAVCVLCLEMEYEASLPEKKSNTLSRDLIDYVRYMIQNHGENYKVRMGCPRASGTQSDSLLHLLQDGRRSSSLPWILFGSQLVTKGKQHSEPWPGPAESGSDHSQPGWVCGAWLSGFGVCSWGHSSDVLSPSSQEMARDEKNYYQDTPKQIKRKINVYKNFYPEEYKDFIASLKQEKMDVQ